MIDQTCPSLEKKILRIIQSQQRLLGILREVCIRRKEPRSGTGGGGEQNLPFSFRIHSGQIWQVPGGEKNQHRTGLKLKF